MLTSFVQPSAECRLSEPGRAANRQHTHATHKQGEAHILSDYGRGSNHHGAGIGVDRLCSESTRD